MSPENKDLHVFFNGYDFVVAESIDDARQVALDQQGSPEQRAKWSPETLALVTQDVEGDGWEQWPDDRRLKLVDDGGKILVDKPCTEWVHESGRGWLGGNEV